ncbi:MAG: hypothetical protein J6Y37_08640 [Paludibacteraceae bacterium]|nr:hypothetical protein [Paludibacteraceae bacterium]
MCKIFGKEPVDDNSNVELARLSLREKTTVNDAHDNDNAIVLGKPIMEKTNRREALMDLIGKYT